ncbi:unnamed protein product [Protopolystoma xenopodis]|uniref:Uncharacterized protein n=1 Tax=Protopolystoma xenopodis TaxID=117903 RepID=A0A3S5C8B2_9PLAT|nr:unnamed protein product [Protopolystoma xenopodis]
MKKAIEDLFTQDHISGEDIEVFQEKYWEQMVPNFSQALKLLDIHSINRHNVLWNINDRLLETIKNKIESKSDDKDKKVQRLWQRLIKTGMVYIHHPYMRSLIMQVLGKMHSIKDRHVYLIVDSKYLYDDAPLPVLRHIWSAHPQKFREEFDKVLVSYQNNWMESMLDSLYAAITSSTSASADLLPMIYWPPRRRRKDPSVVRIVEMIGDKQVLYEKAVTILREECINLETALAEQAVGAPGVTQISSLCLSNSQNPARKRKVEQALEVDETYLGKPSFILQPFTSPALLPNQQAIASSALSTLRFDLLMSLNEAKNVQLCVPDAIHRFVWCMDACIRTRRIDRRHASEMAYHLELQRSRWRRKKESSFSASSFVEEVRKTECVYPVRSYSGAQDSDPVEECPTRPRGRNKHKLDDKLLTLDHKTEVEDDSSLELGDAKKACLEHNVLERLIVKIMHIT